MSFKASGTLRSVLSLCFLLSATIPPALSAPTAIQNTSPWIPRSLKSLFDPRAATNKCKGTGLYITNSGSGSQTYTVFQGATSITSDPYKSVTIAKGKSAAVTLPEGFIGHVQRGSLLPATWIELHMVSGKADGDVSLEIGCDGAATVRASAIAGGGTPPTFGFSKNINANAPADALFDPQNPTGEVLGGKLTTATGVLDATGDATVINQHTLTYEQSVLSQSQAYLFGGVGTNQAIASDNCLLITFY